MEILKIPVMPLKMPDAPFEALETFFNIQIKLLFDRIKLLFV